MKRRTWWAAALAGLLAVSCSTDGSTDMVFDPDPGDDGGGEVVTFAQVQDVFDGSCSCHLAGTFPNLSAAQSYLSIVDGASSQGMPLVDPGDPGNSYLFLKIAGTDGIVGGRMPFGGPPFLTAGQIDAVEAWIERGAPND